MATEVDREREIIQIESEISQITNWKDADVIWKRFQDVADLYNLTSTMAMWKWKKSLVLKIKQTSLLEVKDKDGRVRIKENQIKCIYKGEYKYRLQTRLLLYELQGLNTRQHISLNNGILKLNSSVLPSSEGYISQYTP